MIFQLNFQLFLSIYCFLQCIMCEDIYGCGGFVKSSFTINYSRVEIKLYTKQGNLKYHTDCAPNNGNYLIPLYDKGDYVLKIEPPEGWTFSPSSVNLHVDGKTDPCSLNQDINFIFKGFTVTGQVLSLGERTGPSGIKLELKNLDGTTIKDTLSSENGQYSLTEVLPGKYNIDATHPKWMFKESSEAINIVDDNFKTRNQIVIAGYDVTGSVFSDGEPIQGVHFLLFSSQTLAPVVACSSELVKGFGQKVEGSYVCHVKSSPDGKFTFPCLPPGSYKIVPFYKGEHIEFDVSPGILEFTVKEGSMQIEESFQVQGFSVSGWISTGPKGKSIPDAKVFINNEELGVSDANGIYHLENMRAGTYHLEIKKPTYVFPPKTMKINPNTPRLPDIYADQFSICGHVKLEDLHLVMGKSGRQILLRCLESGDEKMVSAETDGNFCVDVVNGKYHLEPVLSDSEINSGLKFAPDKVTIQVVSAPVLHIHFQQLKADVKGRVKCIDECNGFEVDMVPVSMERPHYKAIIGLNGAFHFEKCLPGNYLISVSRDEWCFQSKTSKLTILDKDVSIVEFTQTGYLATITLSHASSFKVKYPSGEFHDIELGKSKNSICLPEKGGYEFVPVGCHLYKKDVFKFDTGNPSEISLSPIKHLVTGSVLTESNVTDLKVFVKKQTGSSDDIISLQEPLDMKNGLFRYTFSLFAQPNSELELRASSKQLLFRPVMSFVKVADDCLENAVEIVGKKGLFLNGSIKPILQDVAIKVYLKSTNTLTTEIKTNEAGTYSIGPLEDLTLYNVVAEAEGYVFTPLDGAGNFAAFKLAEIVVDVKSNDGVPLQGVLLSLSGGTDYRKNSITQKNGRVSFMGLGPEKYFLRSMLKEYSFEPPSKMIDIKEGTQVNVEIRGKRVAYSVYGSVTSLTGEAEVGISVEAISKPSDVCQQYQEEAISEQGGSFRIRGLHPNCEYTLRLKSGIEINQHIERSIPKELTLKVTNGDIMDVRLIVFRYYNQLDISGNVVTGQEYLQTLRVRLYREDVPDRIIHSIGLGYSSFFYLPSMPMDNKNYVLQLETSLPTISYYFEQPSVEFCANVSFHHFTLQFDPKPRNIEQEVQQGSILALPLAMLVLILAYNYDKLLPVVTGLMNSVMAMTNSSTKVPSGDSPTGDNGGLKKKLRPKRIG